MNVIEQKFQFIKYSRLMMVNGNGNAFHVKFLGQLDGQPGRTPDPVRIIIVIFLKLD